MRPKRKPKLEIDSFVLEVTRRCNMACDHCLRGGPHPGDLDPRLLRRFLSRVACIGEVTFTGGEPSLNIGVMRKFYEICEQYRIPVGGFFVATNGKENQLELAAFLLDRWHKSDDREACGVALSVDAFHDDADQTDVVKGLGFYTDSKEHSPNDLDWPFTAGSAQDNGLGTRRRNTAEEFYLDEPGFPGATVRVDTLYLSLNGMVYPDCDLSVEEEDAALENPDDCPTEALPAGRAASTLTRRWRKGRTQSDA